MLNNAKFYNKESNKPLFPSLHPPADNHFIYLFFFQTTTLKPLLSYIADKDFGSPLPHFLLPAILPKQKLSKRLMVIWKVTLRTFWSWNLFSFHILHTKTNNAMGFKINHTNYYMQRNPKAIMRIFTEGIPLIIWLAKHNAWH